MNIMNVDVTSYRWLALFLSFIQMFLYGFILNSIPPVLPLIITEFSITYAEAGLLMTLFAVPAIVISIPGALIIPRFGVRKVALGGLGLLLIGGLITVFSVNFAILLFGRLISGIAGTLLFVTSSTIIPQWFEEEGSLGKAMGIFAITIPVSVLLVLVIGAKISELYGGWRNWLLLGVFITIVVLFLTFILLKERHLPKKDNTSITVHKETLYNRKMWLVGLAWLCFNITSTSLVTYGPAFLASEKSFSLSVAGIVMSLYMASALPVGPTVGWLTQKYGRKIFIILGNSGVAVLLILVPRTSPFYIPVSLIIIGSFAAMIPPPTFSYPKTLVEESAIGFGIISTCTALAVLVVPIIGYFKDITGAYYASFYAMAISSTIAVLLILLLNERKTKNGYD